MLGKSVTNGVAVATTLACAVGGVALATPSHNHEPYAGCPKGHPLIHRHTRWASQKLAPGVWLRNSMLHDSHGTVAVHVVRADLARPGVALQPLRHSLDSVHRLTSLAGARDVVAATNGMYFDAPGGPPVVPYADDDGSIVMSKQRQEVVGLDSDGRMESGRVNLDARIDLGAKQVAIEGINQAKPPRGLSLYNEAWGSRAVRIQPHARTRVVADDTLGPLQRHSHVPRNGKLLVATTARAKRRLAAAATGAPFTVAGSIKSTARKPFRQVYGVGTRLVSRAHHVRRHLFCRPGAVLVPRTAIGWARGGRELILAVVTVAPGTRQHGLDENQMSYLMSELGAQRAFALDGGGSSEMVARVGRSRRPKIQGALGHQRPIPVGLGVTFTKAD